MNLTEIGIAVRQARKKLNLSQQALAHESGLSRATISALESGKAIELGVGRINAIGECIGLELILRPTSPSGFKRNSKLFQQLRKRYIWWQITENEPSEDRVIAQVMELGTLEDVHALEKEIGIESMKQVLRRARPGWFSGKSWNYWHLKLGLSTIHEVPPIPRRSDDL
jgi:transcriptional regulator with XRE-family HTH domain